MKHYHGANRQTTYFEGWYFKHQKGQNTLALIPGVQMDSNGGRGAFIQVITEDHSYHIPYSISDCRIGEKHLSVQIGENLFSNRGVRLQINRPELRLEGCLRYGRFSPLAYDIMGPFCAVPFLQCRHGVLSMRHTTQGCVRLDGRTLCFHGGTGYIEKDRGRSFPQRYLWTQSNGFGREDCAVMASAATIPMLGTQFDGCICAVQAGGREYRLATYLGAKILHSGPDGLVLRQGQNLFEAYLNKGAPQPLKAPQSGGMSRTIHESAACSMRYRFTHGGQTLFDLESSQAGFEWADGTAQ